MFANKLTISKQTLNKNTLNLRQKGRLRFEKLIEAENNGTLQRASTRKELALIAGFTDEETENGKKGYSWVSNLIQRGYIKETPFDFAADGVYGNEYHVVSSPDYANERAANANARIAASANGKLSIRAKGKMQYDKLCELYKQGALKNISSRLELSELVGCEGPKGKRISWVSNMLARGYLKEIKTTLYDGSIMREYVVTSKKPEYDLAKARKARKNNTQCEIKEQPQAIEEVAKQTPIKIEVSKGDMVIKIEMFDCKEAVELAKQLLKGE